MVDTTLYKKTITLRMGHKYAINGKYVDLDTGTTWAIKYEYCAHHSVYDVCDM